jgi:hypothetical protein
VKLTNFLELGSVYLRRSLSITGVDVSDATNKASSEASSVKNSASTATIYISDAAETVVS